MDHYRGAQCLQETTAVLQRDRDVLEFEKVVVQFRVMNHLEDLKG